jgi:hypothetical protein
MILLASGRLCAEIAGPAQLTAAGQWTDTSVAVEPLRAAAIQRL